MALKDIWVFWGLPTPCLPRGLFREPVNLGPTPRSPQRTNCTGLGGAELGSGGLCQKLWGMIDMRYAWIRG